MGSWRMRRWRLVYWSGNSASRTVSGSPGSRRYAGHSRLNVETVTAPSDCPREDAGSLALPASSRTRPRRNVGRRWSGCLIQFALATKTDGPPSAALASAAFAQVGARASMGVTRARRTPWGSVTELTCPPPAPTPSPHSLVSLHHTQTRLARSTRSASVRRPRRCLTPASCSPRWLGSRPPSRSSAGRSSRAPARPSTPRRRGDCPRTARCRGRASRAPAAPAAPLAQST